MNSLSFDLQLIDKALIIFCIQIFLCRIADVSLGTIRTVLTVKGMSKRAAICGFFEVFIWFIIVREALNSGSGHILTAVFYAGGFATGTLIGGVLSRKLIKGSIEVQIITKTDDDVLEIYLRQAGFGVSVVEVNASEYSDKKKMLFVETENARFKELKKIVMEKSEGAFMTVKDTAYVQNGFFLKK